MKNRDANAAARGRSVNPVSVKPALPHFAWIACDTDPIPEMLRRNDSPGMQGLNASGSARRSSEA